jgi:hypothetical protein
MPRFLRSLLRLILAFVLGLGPLGASVLAGSLHSSLCGCVGCAPSAESCCGSAPEEPEGAPVVVAADACACIVAQPDRGMAHDVAPRTCDARSHARGALERGQRLVLSAWSPEPVPLARSDPGAAASGRHAPHGPPGIDATRGGARLAAFGALRL